MSGGKVIYERYKGPNKERREFADLDGALYAAAVDMVYNGGVPFRVVAKGVVLQGDELKDKLSAVRRVYFGA